MTRWTLVLAAALLAPSVAHAQYDVGVCYHDDSCMTIPFDFTISLENCALEDGASWLSQVDPKGDCVPIH